MARRQRSAVPRFLALVVLAALAASGYYYWPDRGVTGETGNSSSAGPDGPVGNSGGGNPPTARTQPSPRQIASAASAYQAGLALLNRPEPALIAARIKLSEVLAGGGLPAELQAECRAHLTKIAREVLFSRRIYPGDEYARRYVVQPGDVLSTIVRREKVFVPYEGIALINGIDPNQLRAGQSIKLVQGPFDAVVTKHLFTLDLYHHGMFVKSYRIGLGHDGSTPVGRWMAKAGGRVRRAPWTDPKDPTGRQLRPGDPGYPLGKEGLWIELQGLDENTKGLYGFGIHGTNEPESIGKEASLGCIRLADKDIAEVFAFLYPGKSKVEIRP